MAIDVDTTKSHRCELNNLVEIKKPELSFTTCPLCGISGIHACIGKPIPPMTMEDHEKLDESLRTMFLQKAR